MWPDGPAAAGEPLTPTLLLKLQRQVGNQAVLRLLRAVRRRDGGSASPPDDGHGTAHPDVEDRAESILDADRDGLARSCGEAESDAECDGFESAAECESWMGKADRASGDRERMAPDDHLPWWRRLWRWLVRLVRRVWRAVTFRRASGERNRG